MVASLPRTKKEVVLRGSVIETKPGCFTLSPISGPNVTAFASREVMDELVDALDSSSNDARVLVKGTGVYRLDKLERIMPVESVTPLDPLDVPARLDEFRAMRDGWLDGDGKAPAQTGLDWLAASFERDYPNDLPLPYIYPTPEGGVQMEWTLGTIDISLEIDLAERAGDWNWVDLSDSGKEGEKTLNMDDLNSWRWVADELRQVVEGI